MFYIFFERRYATSFARRSAMTISGISTMCVIIPGIAVVKAPAKKAAQVNGDCATPDKSERRMPHTIRPISIAVTSDT